jgi:hypothetical protein
MAEDKAQVNKDGTPRKKRGSSGPRQAKPIYVVATLNGPDGAPVNIDKQSGYTLNLRGTKDSAELVAILTGGSAANAAVIPLEMSQETRANPGETA